MPSIVARFHAWPRVRKTVDDLWVLDADLRYTSAVLRALLVVPDGFVTDLASVPRAPLAFLLAGDRAHGPAIVHDYLYQTHIAVRDRAEADAVFLEAMAAPLPFEPDFPWQEAPVSVKEGWRRRLMWAAVRIAGERAWDAGPDRFRRLGNDPGGIGPVLRQPAG